jgi:hypothetical protein
MVHIVRERRDIRSTNVWHSSDVTVRFHTKFDHKISDQRADALLFLRAPKRDPNRVFAVLFESNYSFIDIVHSFIVISPILVWLVVPGGLRPGSNDISTPAAAVAV